jgi:hypothetical protein
MMHCRKLYGEGHDSFQANHNTQSNKMHYIIPRYFVLQYLVEHCYMFRYVMGSSSGIHIKVTLHKTELAMHVHNRKMKKMQTS